MSLSRAFTTRKLRMSFDSSSDAAKASQRTQTLRHKISAPMQLIHTTNMLSYNAPDLPRPVLNNSPISTSYSSRSEIDSDSIATAETSPPASPDIAKGGRSASPTRKPNHLSDFFKGPATPLFAPDIEPPPAIPQRSPTHTKKNSYDALARAASVSMRLSRDMEVSSGERRTFSRSPSTSTRASSLSVSVPASGTSTTRGFKQPAPPPPVPMSSADLDPLIKEAHPFGPELAQVTELAEEYSGSSKQDVVDEDAEYLRSRGLKKLSADEYLGAVRELSAYFFPDKPDHKPSQLWI